MENLLNSLKTADRICKQANIHFEQATTSKEEINALNASIKKTKTKWILIGIGLWYGISILCGLFNSIPVLGAITTALGGFIGIAVGVYVGTNGYKKAKADIEHKIKEANDQIQSECAKAQNIYDDNYDALAFLPADYWYPLATEYLVNIVSSQRVATLGDALDRYDAQLHRWKLEEANAQMLAQQQTQTAYLKSIDKTSKVNAAANVANAVFNISSKL